MRGRREKPDNVVRRSESEEIECEREGYVVEVRRKCERKEEKKRGRGDEEVFTGVG